MVSTLSRKACVFGYIGYAPIKDRLDRNLRPNTLGRTFLDSWIWDKQLITVSVVVLDFLWFARSD